MCIRWFAIATHHVTGEVMSSGRAVSISNSGPASGPGAGLGRVAAVDAVVGKEHDHLQIDLNGAKPSRESLRGCRGAVD